MALRLTTLVIGILFLLPVWVGAEAFCKSPLEGHCLDLAAAQEAQVGIPGLEFLGNTATPSDLFSKIYTYGISLVGLAAFFMFTFGAIQYMVVLEGSTNQAKERMKNALFGLLLALVSYIGLRLINPDLVKGFNIDLPNMSQGAPSDCGGGAPAC